MRTVLLLPIVLAGCGRIGFGTGELPPGDDAAVTPDVNLSSFSHRKPVTIAAGLTTQPISDLRLLVAATDPELAVARDDGADLVFTDGNGAPLASELATWNRATGYLTAWVRIPAITPTAQTLYLYYGNPDALAGSTPSPWQGYRGVWHLDDAGLADSGPDRIASSALGGATFGAGIVDGALVADGVDDWIDCGSPPSIANFTFTFSVWVNPSLSSSGNDYALDFATTTDVNPPKVSLVVTNGNGRLTTRNDALQIAEIVDTADIRGGWHYLVGTGDGTTGTLYIDGSSVGSYALPTPPITAMRLAIGQHTRAMNCCWFEGALDEARFSETVLSPAVIAAEYRNQSAPQTYVTVGAAEPL